jgi:hypothetical protein
MKLICFLPISFNQSPHVIDQSIEARFIFTCPQPKHRNKIHKSTASNTRTDNRNNYRRLPKDLFLVKYKPTGSLDMIGGELETIDMHPWEHPLDKTIR